jgi:hypothetical protein
MDEQIVMGKNKEIQFGDNFENEGSVIFQHVVSVSSDWNLKPFP